MSFALMELSPSLLYVAQTYIFLGRSRTLYDHYASVLSFVRLAREKQLKPLDTLVGPKYHLV